MTEHKTFPGKTYCVTSAEGCTVTDSTGALSMECEAGKQLHLTAPSDKLFTSASAIVREVFKYAPAKLKDLGLLGGGVDTLPAGYLAAEFLEITGYSRNTSYPNTAPHFKVDLSFLEEADDWGFSTVHSVEAASAAQAEGANITQVADGTLYAFYGRNASGYFYAAAAASVKTSTTPVGAGKQTFAFTVKNRVASATMGAEVFGLGSIPKNPYFIGIFSALKAADGGHLYNYPFNGKKYSWQFFKNSKKLHDLKPCVDTLGVPCMFDKVSKQPFYNSGTGAFIVGMTLSQARKLGKLPAGGGTLTVSLPSNWQEDEGVLNARAEAEAKGWQITVQTHEAEAGAAATFALRRIWVRKTQDEGGSYVAADGSRWSVDWCVDVWGADPQELGYEPYRSVDAAVAYWELEPYVYPEAEQEFLTN